MFLIKQNNKIKHFFFIGIFLLTVFILAIVVWYSPVLFKGYNPYGPSVGSLLVNNLYEFDSYSIENNLNVTLSSNLIENDGILSIRGNKLTPLLYSKIFSVTGLPKVGNLIFLSIFIHALALAIFTGLILYLFDFKLASIFSLVYIFLPFNWQLPYSFCSYEFALLFLSIFFLLFFYGLKHKYSYVYLSVSGIFLVLACLSKEALFLIAPFLLFFLWFKNQKKPLLYIFIPFIILFTIFWLPNISNNSYISLLGGDISKETESADLHLYPDPYTYHFEQEKFLFNLQNKIDNDEIVLMEKIDRIKELKNVEAGQLKLLDRAKVNLVITSRHIFRFISLEDIGGPFIFLLIILGFYSLRQKNKYLYQFFIYWIISGIFLMSFVLLVIRNHLMDFNLAIILLISLGLIFLVELINDYFDLKKKKQFFVYLLFLFVIIYHLVLVNHIAWSKIYDNSTILMTQAYSQEVKKMDIANDDVIAVNLGPIAMYSLNSLTDKSIVIFRPETIEDLLKNNKLDWAFEQFGIKYILGYSDKLSKEIINQVDVINIASDSMDLVKPDISRNKGWLMNLIK